jgi:hypothetical protein
VVNAAVSSKVSPPKVFGQGIAVLDALVWCEGVFVWGKGFEFVFICQSRKADGDLVSMMSSYRLERQKRLLQPAWGRHCERPPCPNKIIRPLFKVVFAQLVRRIWLAQTSASDKFKISSPKFCVYGIATGGCLKTRATHFGNLLLVEDEGPV